MALIPCPQCGKPISDKSSECPKCGHKLHKIPESEQSSWNEESKNEEIAKVEIVEVVVPPSVENVFAKPEQSNPQPPVYDPKASVEEPKQPRERKENQKIEEFSQEPIGTLPVKNSKKGLFTIISLFVCLILIGGGFFWWFYYQNVYLPEKIDREAPRTYPIVNVFLRSSKMAGGDFNKLATVPYGAELITYDEDGEWAKVKYKEPGNDNKATEGFVSSAYLLNKKELYLVNTMFGDNDSREVLATAKVRRGLLDYFLDNNISGKISSDMAAEVGLNYSPTNQWQVIFHKGQTKPNEVLFKRAFDKDSKFTDMLVILENINTGVKKLLYFTYDEDETPILRGVSDYYSGAIKDYYLSDYNRLIVVNENNDNTFMMIDR